MDILLLSIFVVAVAIYFIELRYRNLKAVDDEFKHLENSITAPNKELDPSEDVVYISAHETEQYVHLWQIEPGLNNKEIAYIGRFQKYVMDEYASLVKGFARGKSVEMYVKNPSNELKELVVAAYHKSKRGEL